MRGLDTRIIKLEQASRPTAGQIFIAWMLPGGDTAAALATARQQCGIPEDIRGYCFPWRREGRPPAPRMAALDDLDPVEMDLIIETLREMVRTSPQRIEPEDIHLRRESHRLDREIAGMTTPALLAIALGITRGQGTETN